MLEIHVELNSGVLAGASNQESVKLRMRLKRCSHLSNLDPHARNLQMGLEFPHWGLQLGPEVRMDFPEQP